MLCKYLDAIDIDISESLKRMNITSTGLLKKVIIPIKSTPDITITPHMVHKIVEQKLRTHVPLTWMCVTSDTDMKCSGLLLHGILNNAHFQEHAQFSSVYINGYLNPPSIELQLSWNKKTISVS